MKISETNNRIGNSIQTFTNKLFWPLDPRPEDICIEDIAHALSNKCRFSGHTKDFYCVTPETKVLTAALEWKEAGSLKLNESLLAFDEYPQKTTNKIKNRRKLCESKVLHNGLIYRPTYRIKLSDGTNIRCSADHPWLVTTKNSRNQKWMTTKKLATDLSLKRDRYMLKFLEPWETQTTHDIGYLSGIFDGEGSVCFHHGGINVTIAQSHKNMQTLVETKELLKKYNFSFKEDYNAISNVYQITLTGKWHNKLSFLGQTKPERLVKKITSKILENSFRIKFDSIKLLKIEEIIFQGEQQVVALETSSHTYFAEGFGAHNSVAQHSVIVSKVCDPKDALWGLLHDASEAYLVDLPKPLKILPEFQWFVKVENAVQIAVCKHFGLSLEQPESTHVADRIALVTEKRDLMSHGSPVRYWQKQYKEEPIEEKIIGLTPLYAKEQFLARFHELTLKFSDLK